MIPVSVENLPAYAESLTDYLRDRAALDAVKLRLSHQRTNNLPGDKDTVALCLKYFDVYYSYSDDQSVWRRGNADEQWLIKHDLWFDRCVSVAETYLTQQGLSPVPPTYDKDTHNTLKLSACRRGITDAQWEKIVLPVEKALMVLDAYPLPRSATTYTLPTQVWEGSRDHKVLLVPRAVRDAAEQVRIGMNAAVTQGIPINIWTSCTSNNEDDVYQVSHRRFHIWPTVPRSVKRGGV
jgi:hypothetical protein